MRCLAPHAAPLQASPSTPHWFSLSLDLHRGEPLAVHRDGLAGRVQFYSGRGLCGILHHTDVACRNGSQKYGTSSLRPNPACIRHGSPL